MKLKKLKRFYENFSAENIPIKFWYKTLPVLIN